MPDLPEHEARRIRHAIIAGLQDAAEESIRRRIGTDYETQFVPTLGEVSTVTVRVRPVGSGEAAWEHFHVTATRVRGS